MKETTKIIIQYLEEGKGIVLSQSQKEDLEKEGIEVYLDSMNLEQCGGNYNKAVAIYLNKNELRKVA